MHTAVHTACGANLCVRDSGRGQKLPQMLTTQGTGSISLVALSCTHMSNQCLPIRKGICNPRNLLAPPTCSAALKPPWDHGDDWCSFKWHHSAVADPCWPSSLSSRTVLFSARTHISRPCILGPAPLLQFYRLQCRRQG